MPRSIPSVSSSSKTAPNLNSSSPRRSTRASKKRDQCPRPKVSKTSADLFSATRPAERSFHTRNEYVESGHCVTPRGVSVGSSDVMANLLSEVAVDVWTIPLVTEVRESLFFPLRRMIYCSACWSSFIIRQSIVYSLFLPSSVTPARYDRRRRVPLRLRSHAPAPSRV